MSCLQTASNPPKTLVVFVASLLLAPISVMADENNTYPVAGVNPQQRPEGAPSITQSSEKNDSWYANALKGVEAPYPASLSFLEDQGGWYTPFTRKGMTGPYDIRGWHEK